MWNEARPEQLVGVRIASNGQRSAWQALPADNLGSLLDQDDLSERIGRLLRLLGALSPLDAPEYAIGVGLSPTTMVSRGPVSNLGHRSSATMGSMSGSAVLVLPDEAVTPSGLSDGAQEAGVALSRALLAAFPRL